MGSWVKGILSKCRPSRIEIPAVGKRNCPPKGSIDQTSPTGLWIAEENSSFIDDHGVFNFLNATPRTSSGKDYGGKAAYGKSAALCKLLEPAPSIGWLLCLRIYVSNFRLDLRDCKS